MPKRFGGTAFVSFDRSDLKIYPLDDRPLVPDHLHRVHRIQLKRVHEICRDNSRTPRHPRLAVHQDASRFCLSGNRSDAFHSRSLTRAGR